MTDSRDLEFGVRLAMFGDATGPERFEALARSAEDNGFDVVVGGDHVSFPAEIPPTHYGPEEGSPPSMDVESDAYDLFQALSYMAGATDSIALGTNVCVAPYRHPVLLAKNALTLDALTRGRFEFGVAAGWLHTEFDVLGVPFEERGQRLDEFLEMYERACEEGEIAFDGPFHSFERTGFHPQPVDGPPKLWIGGLSGAAFRRVAEYGDGWTISRQTPEELATSRDRIMNAWDDYDRSGEPEIAVREYLHVGPDAATDDERQVTGPADAVVDQLEDYVDAGATRFYVTFDTDDLDEQLEQLDRIGDDVIPSF